MTGLSFLVVSFSGLTLHFRICPVFRTEYILPNALRRCRLRLPRHHMSEITITMVWLIHRQNRHQAFCSLRSLLSLVVSRKRQRRLLHQTTMTAVQVDRIAHSLLCQVHQRNSGMTVADCFVERHLIILHSYQKESRKDPTELQFLWTMAIMQVKMIFFN